jgi:hypothetical protein
MAIFITTAVRTSNAINVLLFIFIYLFILVHLTVLSIAQNTIYSVERKGDNKLEIGKDVKEGVVA